MNVSLLDGYVRFHHMIIHLLDDSGIHNAHRHRHAMTAHPDPGSGYAPTNLKNCVNLHATNEHSTKAATCSGFSASLIFVCLFICLLTIV